MEAKTKSALLRADRLEVFNVLHEPVGGIQVIM